MCSYNKINHTWSCNNNHTLNYHLRDILGFEGFVMSDWGAIHSPAGDGWLEHGCDSEQGSPQWYSLGNLSQGVSEKTIYKSAHRIARSFIKMGLYDEQLPNNFLKNVSLPEHIHAAR
jgi:beta-glucosidase